MSQIVASINDEKRPCKSCKEIRVIVYRHMCDDCAAEYRHTRYRGWIERKAIKLGRPMPRVNTRRRKNGKVIYAEDT